MNKMKKTQFNTAHLKDAQTKNKIFLINGYKEAVIAEVEMAKRNINFEH
jgi:hypothetical protein